jgi:hypothetical protein
MMQYRGHTFGHLFRLALFTACAGLLGFYWITSYVWSGELTYQHATSAGRSLTHYESQIVSAAGGFCLQVHRRAYTFPTDKDTTQALASFDHHVGPSPSWTGNYEPRYPSLHRHTWHGFDCEYSSVNYISFLNWPSVMPTPIQRAVGLVVPYWALAVVLCLFPAVAVKRRLARRRLEKDKTLCENCGYDLRASPARCPECGTLRPEMHAPIVMS